MSHDTQRERLISDFSVRIYEDPASRTGHRIEVAGNRSGKTASTPTYNGLAWVFVILRLLTKLGAYDRPALHPHTGGDDEPK
jgi:hypothetical protein